MLNFYKIHQEILADENKSWYYYKRMKEELENVEKKMIQEHNSGYDISNSLNYRDKLDLILSSEEPYDIEHQDFYEKYAKELIWN